MSPLNKTCSCSDSTATEILTRFSEIKCLVFKSSMNKKVTFFPSPWRKIPPVPVFMVMLIEAGFAAVVSYHHGWISSQIAFEMLKVYCRKQSRTSTLLIFDVLLSHSAYIDRCVSVCNLLQDLTSMFIFKMTLRLKSCMAVITSVWWTTAQARSPASIQRRDTTQSLWVCTALYSFIFNSNDSL